MEGASNTLSYVSPPSKLNFTTNLTTTNLTTTNHHHQSYFEDKTITALEVRRGLNDVFAYDLIPSKDILEAAFRATRRTNDFPTYAFPPHSTCIIVIVFWQTLASIVHSPFVAVVDAVDADVVVARSVRIFEGIKDKAQSDEIYKTVVKDLQPVVAELQLSTPEELGFA